MTDLTISQELVQQLVNQTVEKFIANALENLQQDPEWVKKIEQMINQTVVDKTIARISGMDVNSVIRKQVTENLDRLKKDIIAKVTPQGIQDISQQVEMTILDEHVVVENNLSTKNIDVVGLATIKNLAVTGTINVDNASWNELADTVAQRTVASVNDTWVDNLVKQVSERITKQGIDFDQVTVGGEPMVTNGTLSSKINNSSLNSVGELNSLSVNGEAHINNTFSVVNRRVGINTREPEMALGIWDDEISLMAGKLRTNTAFIGTSRGQSLTLGVNREPHVEIDVNGLTTVKKLQVGLYRISHGNEVPGYAGTRGDIVFNALPNIENDVLGWVCLGGHKWKVLRTV